MSPLLVAALRRPPPANDHWGWPHDTPDPEVAGDPLHLLTPRDLRVLGKPALAVWSVLERCRGFAARWVERSLSDLSRVTRLAYRTVKRALSRLRACGALECRQYRHRITSLFQLHDHWRQQSSLRAWGAWDLNSGVLRVLLPEQRWLKWATGKASAGRPKSHLARYCGPTAQTFSAEKGGYEGQPATRNQALSSILWPTLTLSPDSPSGVVLRTPPPDAASPPAPESRSLAGGDGGGGLDSVNGSAPALTPRAVPLTLPPLDPLPRLNMDAAKLEEGMSDLAMVKFLASAYRTAVTEVYGVDCKTLRFGDIAKSKLFPRLKASAEVLREHDVPPGAWAEWYLAGGKKRGKTSAAPITLVFAPATIVKWRGWFRRTYDGASGWVGQPGPDNLEQLYRRREVVLLNRGYTPETAVRVAGPPEYVRKRLAEINLGAVDPREYSPRTGTARKPLEGTHGK